MYEQSKAARRRFSDGAFHTRYFVGKGLDVGCGPDPLSQYVRVFRGLDTVDTWDTPQGNAEFLEGLSDGTYDFLHSSHCLEHLHDPQLALGNWIRVVKPGGFLIITLPDEELYEHKQWPSRFSGEHLWSFTLGFNSMLPRSRNVFELVRTHGSVVEIERAVVIRDFFDPFDSRDQTLLPNTECAIELILRKSS